MCEEKEMRPMITHKNLDIWKLGIELVEKEGAARNSKKEFVHFLYVALGSLAELETQTIISEKLGYLKKDDELMELIEKQRRKQLNFMKYLGGLQKQTASTH